MKFAKIYILPIVSGLLYGASWPIQEGLNLSFLAWFAFVPLFLFLEQHRNAFWKSVLGGYGAMVCFCCLAAGWIFNFPQALVEVATAFFLESFWFFFPFLLFYPLPRKLGFDKALWLFPFVWVVWEWIYLPLEFTMGTHLSPYSQSDNIWLIQCIDFTGMWGISFWLMLFNVLIFKAYQSVGYTVFHKDFGKKLAIIATAMLLPPLAYSAWAFANYQKNTSNQAIAVTLIPTQFSAAFLSDEANAVSVVESTLHRTDSVAFHSMEIGKPSDLYVWPETGTSYQISHSNLGSLLFEAVTDWEAALLTGCKGVPDESGSKKVFVSGVLLSHQSEKPSYHHKTVLTPGQEAIPYQEALHLVDTSQAYIAKGKSSEPLALVTKDNRHFQLGVSLCFEQWYPSHWAALARNGADFYTHLAGEGWYGNIGFQQFMANVSRMRCIENRKQAARCANVGYTLFIDQLGRYTAKSEAGTLETATHRLYKSTITTFYANNPNWFPIAMILGSFIILIFIKNHKP